ncbi:hypothetical protein FKM82_017661 [Ascaphus truei]
MEMLYLCSVNSSRCIIRPYRLALHANSIVFTCQRITRTIDYLKCTSNMTGLTLSVMAGLATHCRIMHSGSFQH